MDKAYQFSSPIVDYPQSPTGRAYIGINKLPLMPHEDGNGFKGVLVQTDDKRLVQCAFCGNWFEFLHGNHLKKCANMTAREYKDRYGLHMSTGLISDECSLKRTKWLLSERGKKALERVSNMSSGGCGDYPMKYSN